MKKNKLFAALTAALACLSLCMSFTACNMNDLNNKITNLLLGKTFGAYQDMLIKGQISEEDAYIFVDSVGGDFEAFKKGELDAFIASTNLTIPEIIELCKKYANSRSAENETLPESFANGKYCIYQGNIYLSGKDEKGTDFILSARLGLDLEEPYRGSMVKPETIKDPETFNNIIEEAKTEYETMISVLSNADSKLKGYKIQYDIEEKEYYIIAGEYKIPYQCGAEPIEKEDTSKPAYYFWYEGFYEEYEDSWFAPAYEYIDSLGDIILSSYPNINALFTEIQKYAIEEYECEQKNKVSSLSLKAYLEYADKFLATATISTEIVHMRDSYNDNDGNECKEFDRVGIYNESEEYDMGEEDSIRIAGIYNVTAKTVENIEISEEGHSRTVWFEIALANIDQASSKKYKNLYNLPAKIAKVLENPKDETKR